MKDDEVIAAVLGGDTDQYQALVERYYRGLFNHLLTIVKDAAWAEDLTQEAFIKAYTKLSQYSPSYRFSTWLYRIGTNAALSALRQRRAIGLDDVPELAEQSEPAQWVEVEQREARVRQAVAKLPLKYQTVISLHYWNDQTYEEIALTMDVPIGTIKTWLHRAKNKLKEMLEPSLWTD